MFYWVTKYWASVQAKQKWMPGFQYPKNSPFLVTTAITPSGLYKKFNIKMIIIHCDVGSTTSPWGHNHEDGVTFLGEFSEKLYKDLRLMFWYKKLSL